ncbi:uncharacterized protein LOC127246897 isoform X2 [Andrographis paniculata]|uniref:uncharacterized protein LOC127246897 isoform X2 n=1 Tax=Andrographis paniculata TaxID=175694 RepID=UPI0021E7E366|nr:uncharacterized protein LOC127246897 isoform X2 [Andrographis paniculata]
MREPKSSEKASDREKKWDKVFSALVKLSQNLQKDREFLEHKVKSSLGVIYRMKMEMKLETIEAQLKLGLKERDAFIYKLRHDNADDELSDLGEWLDCVAPKDPKTISDDARDNVRKLKSDMEKYKLEKSSEISALLTEKSFAWNQYNEMESHLREELRKKCDEAERASAKVQILANRTEELQCSNEKLRADLAKMEFESAQKSEEIRRLSKEMELLKSRLGSEITPLPLCNGKAFRGAMNDSANSRVIKGSKESGVGNIIDKVAHTKKTGHKSTGGKPPMKLSVNKGKSSSKRRMLEEITIPDTPKLFSASFKVPKLKPSFKPETT